MERGLIVERAAMEEEGSPSRCSSGCQSGWTLYLLDHSSVDAAQRCIHLQPAQRWTVPRAEPADDDDDDSMVSDASSGPSPRPIHVVDDDDDDVELRRDWEHRCYSGSASDSESSYGSWSRIFQDQASRDGDKTTRQLYHDGDDLDDTASSASPVFSSPVAAMMYIAPAKSMSGTSFTTL